MDPLVILGVVLALAFNAVNGFNDVAHSVATSVATRAISPGKAILMAACANFAGPFIFAPTVAITIGTSLVASSCLSPRIVISGLAAALLLVLLANRKGLPVSSSHALVGGLLGGALAGCGLSGLILPSMAAVEILATTVIVSVLGGVVTGRFIGKSLGERTGLWQAIGVVAFFSTLIPLLLFLELFPSTGILLVVTFLVVSPTLGFLAAFVLDVLISHIFRHSRQTLMRRVFQPLQLGAGLVQAVGHGANDGQHAVGAITALLLSAGLIADFSVPFWVLFVSAAAIGIGTGLGGWRVIDRIAKNITRIRPYQGFSAAVSGAVVLAVTTGRGIPVSSSHVISGAIIGVGVTRGEKAVQWQVVREILMAWILTLPLSLALGSLLHVGGFLLFP